MKSRERQRNGTNTITRLGIGGFFVVLGLFWGYNRRRKQRREAEINKTLKIIFYTALLIPTLMISSCAFPLGWDDSGRKYPLDTLFQGTEKTRTAYAKEQEAREKYVKEHPELSPEIKEQLLHGCIIRGMTKEQVRLFSQFSRPPDKIRTTTRYRADEMWIYNFKDSNQRIILYFKSNILVEWKYG